MPFGAHWFELLPLVLLALLFFGPKRLPEMGSAIGKTIKEFQKSMREVKEPEPPTAAALPLAATTDAPQLPQPSAAATTTSAALSAATAVAPTAVAPTAVAPSAATPSSTAAAAAPSTATAAAATTVAPTAATEPKASEASAS